MFLQVLSLFKLHIWRNRKAKWSAIGHTVPAKEWSKPRHRSPHSKNKGMEGRNSLRSFYQENPFSLFGWGPAYLLESVGEKLARCGGKRLAGPEYWADGGWKQSLLWSPWPGPCILWKFSRGSLKWRVMKLPGGMVVGTVSWPPSWIPKPCCLALLCFCLQLLLHAETRVIFLKSRTFHVTFFPKSPNNSSIELSEKSSTP